MRRIHPQLAQAEGQRLARGVIREMVHDTRDGAPEEVEARAEMQEGAGMGARGRGRCALHQRPHAVPSLLAFALRRDYGLYGHFVWRAQSLQFSPGDAAH